MDLFVPPVSGNHLPAGHEVQEAAPEEFEYVPASHAVQETLLVAPIEAEYVPAMQGLQTALLVAPIAVEKVPALQGVQTLAPAIAEYEPASQSVHSVPCGISGPGVDRLSSSVGVSVGLNVGLSPKLIG